jgi:hypothetical protein
MFPESVVLTCWVFRFIQAAFKPTGGRNGVALFSRHLLGLGSTQWDLSRLPCIRGPVYHRVLFCLMLYHLLFKKKERKKEKGEMARKIFPQGRHTLLAVMPNS